MAFPESIHLFCCVVDNLGDIGVSWRLSRQLVNEHAMNVTLWVDDLASFHKICADIDPRCTVQKIYGVEIVHWHDDLPPITAGDVADLVIEAFGCELPPAYIAAMAVRDRKPVWINLEYLSAEPWVEGCHGMQSLYPSLPLIKYFFFPGFSNKTGGLLMERDAITGRTVFQKNPGALAGFLKSIDVSAPEDACKISLFCYPDAPVLSLFNALQAEASPSICLVPQGVAVDAVSTFLQQPAAVAASATRGGLTVQVIPFLNQPDYDRLLWACDLNFVRGEDSLVRAQWAARPFVWHIYPQQEDAHRIKLNAFLDRYTARMPDQMAHTVTRTWHAWNGMTDGAAPWRQFRSVLPELASQTADWASQLLQNGDLASNLVKFVQKIG